MSESVQPEWTSEELDIINDGMSVSTYLKYKDNPIEMRRWVDRVLRKRRAAEAKDLEVRYQRIVRRSNGRMNESAMMNMAITEHRQVFSHQQGD